MERDTAPLSLPPSVTRSTASASQVPMISVASVMTRDLVTLTPRDTVRRAAELMRSHEIRHIPVVGERGELVGMVSDRDLREYTLPTLVQVRDPAQHRAFQNTPLNELMRTALICVRPDEPIQRAIEIMLDYSVGAVPVVRDEAGTLCGIVSYVDVLWVAARVL
ncbi:MAG: CBS domain-containing protein [Nannocystaceae bacterium]